MNAAIKGFGWNSIGQAYRVLFSSIVLIILARLISVEEFGIVGMSMAFVLFFNTMLNIGFDSSIIFSKNLKEESLFSLFVLNIIFGLLIYCFGYLSSPIISSFYRNDDIEVIFRFLIIGVPLSSIGIISKGYLQKKLKFKSLAVVDLAATTLAGISAIILASLDFGYWALICQQLISVGLSSIGYLAVSYKSVFKSKSFDISEIKPHLKFGYNVFIFNLLNFFAQQSDVLLVGKLLGEKQTGLYILAFNLILKPVGLIIQVFNKTIFPLLAGIKKEYLAERYTYYTHLFLFTMTPLIVLAVSLSQTFAPYLLTKKWESISFLLIVFGYQSIRNILGSPSGTIFLITGHPEKQWKFSLFISLPLRLLGVFLGYYYLKSALGVAIGINVFATIEVFIGFNIVFKLISLKNIDYYKSIKFEILSSLILSLTFFLVNNLIKINVLSVFIQVLFFGLFVALSRERFKKLIKNIKAIK